MSIDGNASLTPVLWTQVINTGMCIIPREMKDHIDHDGLVQERRNSNALAMELRLSWINPSI